MSKLFTISDTHFGHFNILKYEPDYRPFENIQEMNQFMIEQWNSVVGPNDTTIHCGDFGFGGIQNISNIFSKLNGKIILIKGNHDRMSNSKLERIGFSQVYKSLCCGTFIFSHKPIPDGNIPANMINIHGHTHSKPTPHLDPATHWNVSVEMVNYTPVELSLSLLECDQRGGK